MTEPTDAPDLAALANPCAPQTTDAEVWADEFLSHYTVHTIDGAATEGVMVGWFANAIETGRSAGYQAALDTGGAPGWEYPTVGKLVRDLIPDVIRANGREPITREALASERAALLMAKLDEEIAEFRDSEDVAELADVLEVVYALAADYHVQAIDLEKMRLAKREERGAFKRGLVWLGNEDARPTAVAVGAETAGETGGRE